MKALTLTQPWASLVACGEKRFETRSWQPYHLGQVAIHAAKGMPTWVPEVVEGSPVIRGLLDEHGWSLDELPMGAMIAVARLEWAEPTSSVYLQDVLDRLGGQHERDLGDYGPGHWAWYLTGVHQLSKPIPALGKLGLWEWTPPPGWLAAEREEAGHAG